MLSTAMTLLAETGDAGGSALTSLLPLAAFGALMYFLIIRPQRKRQQEQQDLQESLAVGADVVTIGGMHGTVDAIGDDWLDLTVDADGTVLRFQRQSIARIVGSGETADDASGPGDAAAEDE